VELTAKAYVSWGLWVADCPRPDCLGAEHHGHAPITGVVGGLTRQGFRCARCGLVCQALWPANAEDVWFVLAQRPVPETRNWMLGEHLDDLLAENLQYGIMPPGLDAGITIVDGRFTDRALVAASRFAIGA
jgi:hypothetical protein